MSQQGRDMKKDKLSLVLVALLVALIIAVGILVTVFFSRSRQGDTATLHSTDVVSVSETTGGSEVTSMEEGTSEVATEPE